MAKKVKKFIEGNNAIVDGAIAAGARFYAGYPISPSSEIAEGAAKELPRHGGVYIQMEDEISSMGSAARCIAGWQKVLHCNQRSGIFPDAGEPRSRDYV